MNYDGLIQDISLIHQNAQASVARSINRVLTTRNWFLGAYLVEYEQNGEDRAAYGTELLGKLVGLGVSSPTL